MSINEPIHSNNNDPEIISGRPIVQDCANLRQEPLEEVADCSVALVPHKATRTGSTEGSSQSASVSAHSETSQTTVNSR